LRFFGKFIKKKYNSKTDSDVLFSLSSAYLTIESKMGLKISGRCALSLKSISGMYFNEMKDDIKRFLDISKTDFELTYRTVIDSYGYLWVILEGKKMEDLLAGISAVGDTVDEKGFSDQLLAAIFEFTDDRNRKEYLIYNYKRNTFYPFVPLDNGKKSRNTEEEMKIMATIGDEVPLERDMTLWYPLWDLPL
jgi:PspAB-like protein